MMVSKRVYTENQHKINKRIDCKKCVIVKRNAEIETNKRTKQNNQYRNALLIQTVRNFAIQQVNKIIRNNR